MAKRKKIKNKQSVRRKIKILEKLYQLNKNWPYLEELKNLVLKISPPSFPQMERRLAKLGRIKLAILTGVFLNIAGTRVDIMVVGDDIDFRRFSDFIKKLETDMGVELRYVVLGLNEFKYRFDMFDRFVRDILEYPHRKVIDKIKVS